MCPMSPRLLRPRASGGFDPRSISGLALWLDASDSSTLTLSGSSVSEWRDKSGNGFHVAQSTANNQPAIQTVAGLNNRQAILFDGTNDVLLNTTTGILASGTPALTVIIAHRTTTLSSNRFECLWDIAQGATYAGKGTIRRLMQRRDTSANPYAAFGFTDAIYGGLTTASNTAYVHSLVIGSGVTSASNPQFFRNGSASSRTGVVGSDISPAFTPSRFSIGSSSQGANEFANAQIAEVFLFNRVLSNAERQAVERYLANKWGIALYSPPSYADADVNAYITAVEAADGQALETGVRDAINTFITGCKSDGIWSAIRASCILMGARTLAGALTPLAGTAPTNVNFVSGDYNRKTGLIGNASTKYLDTNRAGNADPQNNFHASVFGSALDGGAAAGQSAVRVWMSSASTSNATKNAGLFNFAGGGIAQYFFNARRDSGNTTWISSLDTFGFAGVTRTSSTAVTGRAKSTNNSFTVTSQAPTSDNYTVFASNTGGVIGDYSAARLAFYSIGESLTLSLLDSRVNTLYSAIGAAIP